jgi:hypothetical protein
MADGIRALAVYNFIFPHRRIMDPLTSPTLNSGSTIFVGAGTVGITDTLLTNFGGGTHSLTGPAGFVDSANNNDHLAPESAAIDAGVDPGINFDIDGNPRPIGNGFDIGFDEALNRLFLSLVRR